jgi:uncharacterized protein
VRAIVPERRGPQRVRGYFGVIVTVGLLSGGGLSDQVTRRRVTLAEVRAHREKIEEIARRYGVQDVRVFGSVARGESTEASDLDLLVSTTPGRGLLALSQFALDVEDDLGVLTQVATANGLKERHRERVLAEAVPL